MRKLLSGGVFCIVVFVIGASGAPNRRSLVPPARSTRESRMQDIKSCIAQAKADLSSGKPLDDDAKLLLQGHRTEGFIREGRMGVDRDFVPTASGSLFVGRSGLYGPADLSDRYVVCLLKRGYSWPGSSGSSPGAASPHEVESATKLGAQPEITKIAVGYYPQGIAFTPGAIWVAYDKGRAKKETSGVFRIDPDTSQVVATVLTGKVPGGAAAGEGAVWIVNFGDNSVTRIDPQTNRVAATIAVGKGPFGVDVGAGAVWVTNATSNTVSRIDPKTNTVIATILVGNRPAGIAVEGDFVWVANCTSKSVSRISAKKNTILSTIKVGDEPITITARGTDVWVSSESRSGLSVSRIDTKSNTVVAKTIVGTRGKVGGTALLNGALWVADQANGALWQLDVQTNAITGGPIAVGDYPMILGVGTDGNGALWLSNPSDGAIRRVRP